MDWYDYGARMYDPALGRWHVPDAYSEWFDSQSPYSYVSNNPLNAIDPDGNFETKFGAFMYKVFYGGGKVLQDKGGEYFVLQKGENKGDADITMDRVFEVQEYGDSENQPSFQEMEETLLAGTEQKDFSGLEGKWDYFSNGGSFDGFDYNLKGAATGVTLTTGITPSPAVGAAKTGKVVRSAAQKAKYLKELYKSGKAPQWMSPWLKRGKVPPGHQVDHYIALSDKVRKGKDIPANMRLRTTSDHRVRHRFYRPWQKKK